MLVKFTGLVNAMSPQIPQYLTYSFFHSTLYLQSKSAISLASSELEYIKKYSNYLKWSTQRWLKKTDADYDPNISRKESEFLPIANPRAFANSYEYVHEKMI